MPLHGELAIGLFEVVIRRAAVDLEHLIVIHPHLLPRLLLRLGAPACRALALSLAFSNLGGGVGDLFVTFVIVRGAFLERSGCGSDWWGVVLSGKMANKRERKRSKAISKGEILTKGANPTVVIEATEGSRTRCRAGV